jgi:hypothetical protein
MASQSCPRPTARSMLGRAPQVRKVSWTTSSLQLTQEYGTVHGSCRTAGQKVHFRHSLPNIWITSTRDLILQLFEQLLARYTPFATDLQGLRQEGLE